MAKGAHGTAGQGEVEDNFGLTNLFQSYVNKPEITDLAPNFLVKGSKNVLIDYAQRIVSRNGFALYNQTNTGKGGIKGSYEWDTSTGSRFALRSYDHSLEFDWNGTFNTLLSTLRSPLLEFAKVLDYTEQQDILLFVLGDGASMRRWSGGVSKVRSSTGTTLTKQGVLTAVSTIGFVAGDGSTVNPTITDSNNNFLNAGFAAGDSLNVSGSSSNNSNFTIASVTAGVITLIMSDVLVNEAAGSAVTMYNQTGPTWKSARFFSSVSGRSILYNGVAYTYTGGETTDTLTGLTSFPAVTVGDAVWQASDTITLPSAVTSPFPNFYPDLIAVQLNMVFLASTKNQMVFASKNIDYTNFTITSPRAPGDPMQQPLTSGSCTCIVPIDNDSQQLGLVNTLIFGSGVDAFDQIDFHMSQDNTAELLRIIRYKTAQGSGLYSKSAICPIKSNTVYISREPSLNTLAQGNLEAPDGKKNAPISDPIKNDFDSYDFTNAHMKYWKRALYIALPASGIVLIYDLQRSLWQPPQTIPVGRFAIIGDWLYGHSSVTNETYKLFSGTNDNGVAISQVARFAYNNGGSRNRLKNMSTYWSDGYITANGELDYNVYLGFNGEKGIKPFSILGSDTKVTTSLGATPLGDDELGADPLGGSPFLDVSGLPGAGTPLLRFWQEDTMKAVDYIEFFTEYAMNTLDGQFALVAHGSNQWDAGTAPISHKK